MNSSYKNQDIDYGELIEAITLSQNPTSIIEIGILDGYSLHHFINSTTKTTIQAYDIFDKFNGNHDKEAELKANRMILSGGLGYRNKGVFVDLTYAHSFNKDVDFAYRLADKANTYAVVKNQRGNIVVTLGFKF